MEFSSYVYQRLKKILGFIIEKINHGIFLLLISKTKKSLGFIIEKINHGIFLLRISKTKKKAKWECFRQFMRRHSELSQRKSLPTTSLPLKVPQQKIFSVSFISTSPDYGAFGV
jgi:hypothetical protein